jgi:hypothetical protein
LVRTLTQSGARGDGGPKLPPSLALGYILTPLHGSEDEAAASLPLHFLRSAQSPVLLSEQWACSRAVYQLLTQETKRGDLLV